MWSIVSVILLIAGIAALVWYHTAHKEEADPSAPAADPLLAMRVTPSMRATLKYFYVVIGLMDLRTGEIDKAVMGVSGSDEVWFNAGDGNYYLAARNQPGGPVLGVIDARSQSLVQLVPTINTAGQANVFPAGTAHSVAADARNNHIFVPLSANNAFPNCLNGCIAVYSAPRDDGR